MKLKDFESTKPEFRMEEYFAGKSRAWGIVFDRSGKVTRQFTVDLVGGWEGDEFLLKEDFLYSDGETQKRTWHIKKIDDSSYEGTASDVVGTALGKALGQALQWKYTLRLPVKGTEYEIQFDDWMILQPDGVLMNRATMRKWGFKVGEIVLSFQKQSA